MPKLKSNSIIVIILMWSTLQLLTAQTVEYRYLNAIDETLETYQTKLNLTLTETKQYKSILVESKVSLGKCIDNPNFESCWLKTTEKKDVKLQALLGSQRWKLYKILHNSEVKTLLEINKEISLAIQLDKDLNQELLEYKINKMLPLLSTAHHLWTNQLTVENHSKLQYLQSKYYEFGDVITSDDSYRGQSFLDWLTAEDRVLWSALVSSNSEAYTALLIKMDGARKQWSQDQERIIQDHYGENIANSYRKKESMTSIYNRRKQENPDQKSGFFVQLVVISRL